MKQKIKKLIPKIFLDQYHRALAIGSKFFYGRPSEKMIVIGVTGTNGKTTIVSLIAKILNEAGCKTGAASTAIFKIGGKEWLNDKKMTMLGRFALQKLLRDMVKAGCRYAIVETSSQGIEQFRHLGIHYDACVFTNLTPEHIEAHGGFANYKQAKLKLFQHLENLPEKILNSPPFQGGGRGGLEGDSKPFGLPLEGGERIPKVIIVNGDDKYAGEFLDFTVDEKIIYSITKKQETDDTQYSTPNSQIIIAKNIEFNPGGVSFKVDETQFNLKLFGLFNVYNSLAAIAVAKSQGVSLEVCQAALGKIDNISGRMEFIDEGQDFKVLVDYAPEPESIRQLYRTISQHKITSGKIIHVLGSCGGGRDVARRPILGKLAGGNADYVIATNEDPYDDDPHKIIDDVAFGAQENGKILNKNLFKIADRKEAIEKAIGLAQAGDLVLLTGKGCEQAICVANGKKIPWDEREVVRRELRKIF